MNIKQIKKARSNLAGALTFFVTTALLNEALQNAK
jgi:hypothetical protein